MDATQTSARRLCPNLTPPRLIATPPAGSENSLGAESVRDARPSTGPRQFTLGPSSSIASTTLSSLSSLAAENLRMKFDQQHVCATRL
jgi:hypothetical protein